MKSQIVKISLLITLLSGCAGSRQITSLDAHLPKKEKLEHHATVDSLLNHYFTDDAYASLKNIPLVDGPAVGGYAAGVNIWANLASLLTLNGWGRKVILPSDSIKQHGVGGIVHEYIHHIDDMCRDGDLNLLNLEEFIWAYKLTARDMRYAGICLWVETRANSFWNVFGVGDLGEHIAYTAQYIVTKDAPDYLRWVFRKVLRLKFRTRLKVTTTNGRIEDVDLTNRR